jgi:hypothetical protein
VHSGNPFDRLSAPLIFEQVKLLETSFSGSLRATSGSLRQLGYFDFHCRAFLIPRLEASSVPKRSLDVCGYKGCGEAAQYIIEVDGKSLPLCKDHYKNILKRIEARAAEAGTATLDQLSLIEGEEGAFSLVSRRAKKV